jgi:hypothetical protein
MGSKKSKTEKLAGEDTGSNTEASTPAAEKTPAAPKSRGPRGTVETAVITLLAPTNPKRVGSKAHAAFANYVTGMTVGAFADAVGKEATGHLVYDAKHGFISIDGYDPGAIIAVKVREPKAPKEKKAKAEKTEADVAQEAEVNAETMA